MAKTLPVDLGNALRKSLDAFCEAHYNSSKTRVIREALKSFISDRLQAEPEMRRRYDAIFTGKLEGIGEKVSVLDVHKKR